MVRRRLFEVLRIALLLLLLILPGCDEKEKEVPSRSMGEVRASPAYIDYFGRPPVVEEGSCYAYVGFYPPADDPQKVRPFPLFLFNPTDHPQIIVEQLIGWGEGWDLGGVFSNPFPEGTRLVSIRPEEGDMMRVEISEEVLERTGPGTQRVIAGLLGHSLVQFEGIARVMVVSGGKLLPGQAERGFVPDREILREPGPPVAIAAMATWEKGSENPEEVSVSFDRPVRIDAFTLTDSEGEELEGKYYRSVFDMAVVIHPAKPGDITEGMSVRVDWEGEDFLERGGKQSKEFRLRRIDHSEADEG